MRRYSGATASLVGSAQGRAARERGFLRATIAFGTCSGRGVGTVPIPSPGLFLLFQKADPATSVSPVQGFRGVLGGPRLGGVSDDLPGARMSYLNPTRIAGFTRLRKTRYAAKAYPLWSDCSRPLLHWPVDRPLPPYHVREGSHCPSH